MRRSNRLLGVEENGTGRNVRRKVCFEEAGVAPQQSGTPVDRSTSKEASPRSPPSPQTSPSDYSDRSGGEESGGEESCPQTQREVVDLAVSESEDDKEEYEKDLNVGKDGGDDLPWAGRNVVIEDMTSVSEGKVGDMCAEDTSSVSELGSNEYSVDAKSAIVDLDPVSKCYLGSRFASSWFRRMKYLNSKALSSDSGCNLLVEAEKHLTAARGDYDPRMREAVRRFLAKKFNYMRDYFVQNVKAAVMDFRKFGLCAFGYTNEMTTDQFLLW